ncbi:MAG: type II secretion system protein [Alphaproteobacteria bacterium]|nr:type II secretion system protein [Alphaproteobacteria bacterium]
MADGEHGRSMIEMLGVLAIVGILSVGGISGFNKAMTKFKIAKLKEQMATITMNVVNIFRDRYNYAELGTDPVTGAAMAVRLNLIPREMVRDDGSIMHPFNGKVYIYAVDYADKPNSGFAIDFDGLPRAVAVELAINGENESNASLMNLFVAPLHE